MTSNNNPLQIALFQAAKIGNIDLMRECIRLGADPFAINWDGRSALSYAMASNRRGAGVLFMELAEQFEKNNPMHIEIEGD